MLLAYIDESGKSYEVQKGFFKDGSHAIWSAVLVPENKYFHTERMFYEVVNNLLGVKDWRKIELHARDIWNRKGYFKKFSYNKVRDYFEELFQLLSKLKLDVVAGVQQKNINIKNSNAKNKELENSVYALLTCLEHKLSELDETAVLIADSSGDEDELERIQKLLYARTQWRYNPGAGKVRKFKSKFLFETQSCFLLDQIHYTDSNTSLFVQLSDHVSFVLQRVLTYSYLKKYPKKNISADLDKVPLTPSTFKFFAFNISMGEYDRKARDISMDRLENYIVGLGEDEYLNPDYVAGISEFK